jgi:hypothetical protein
MRQATSSGSISHDAAEFVPHPLHRNSNAPTGADEPKVGDSRERPSCFHLPGRFARSPAERALDRPLLGFA